VSVEFPPFPDDPITRPFLKTIKGGGGAGNDKRSKGSILHTGNIMGAREMGGGKRRSPSTMRIILSKGNAKPNMNLEQGENDGGWLNKERSEFVLTIDG